MRRGHFRGAPRSFVINWSKTFCLTRQKKWEDKNLFIIYFYLLFMTRHNFTYGGAPWKIFRWKRAPRFWKVWKPLLSRITVKQPPLLCIVVSVSYNHMTINLNTIFKLKKYQLFYCYFNKFLNPFIDICMQNFF